MDALQSIAPADPAVGSLVVAPLAGDPTPFRGLTYPRLGARLDRLPAGMIALGARLDGRAAGLAILGTGEADGACEVVSVMVAADLRRRGIATALLGAGEAVAQRAGRERLVARLASRMRGFAPSAAFFTRAGFSAPRLTLVNLTGEVGPMASCVFTPDWRGVLRRAMDPRTYDFEPWCPLRPDERADLARLRGQPAYHAGFDFDHLADRIDPVCSLKIHRHGRLVGWIVAEPLANALAAEYPDRICRHYVTAYLDEALWHTGVMLAGYYHAFSRQAAAYGERSIANYFSNMPRQMELSRRRFAPMALRWDEIHTVEKPVGSPAGTPLVL